MESFFSYPGQTCNTLIRTLVIVCGSTWAQLRRLAQGFYGFENLRPLNIVVFRTGMQALLRDGRNCLFRFVCDENFNTYPRCPQVQELEGVVKFGCSKDKCGVVADLESDSEMVHESNVKNGSAINSN
jgi:hypothetical protein